MSVRPTATKAFKGNWSGLLGFPRRLLFPPFPKGAQRVGSFKITPTYEIALEDVLSKRHLPPISLYDFQEYLLYVEMSPENLHFILWLREYTTRYQAWFNSPERDRDAAIALSESYARARITFFKRESQYQLNLSSELVEELDSADSVALRAGSDEPPAPELFGNIKESVWEQLRLSLTKFVAIASVNTSSNRGYYGILIGVTLTALSYAPMWMVSTHGYSHWVRLAALPCLLFGISIIIASWSKVCFILFMMGDCRQLYPFELARPSITLTPPTPARDRALDHHANDLGLIFDPSDIQDLDLALDGSPYFDLFDSSLDFTPKDKPKPATTEVDAISPFSASDIAPFAADDIAPFATNDIAPFAANDIAPFADVDFAGPPPGAPVRKADYVPPILCPPQPTLAQHIINKVADRGKDNEDDAGSPRQRRLGPTKLKGPAFGPLARVESPIILRAYWDVMIRSLIFALPVAVLIQAIYLGLPSA